VSEKTYLIAGLGNIGAEYSSTRHNVGFMILDAWAQASGIVFSTERYGDLAHFRDKGRELWLLKPSTYMNLSGNAVRYWQNRLEVPLQNIMVICDDLNLPFGTVRMRKSGSDGGHNGLKNIEEMLGTRDFARTRVGVGHDFAQGAQVGFVLGSFSEEQMEALPEIEKRVTGGMRTWVLAGPEKAMTELNSKANPPKEAKNEENSPKI
jgi:peptidyl-tRNA hydrolase, PTH1 family